MNATNQGFSIISIKSQPITAPLNQTVLSFPSAVILFPFGEYTVENLSLVLTKKSYFGKTYCEVIRLKYGEYPQEICLEELVQMSFYLKGKAEPL